MKHINLKRRKMNKTVYRFVSFALAFALAFGASSPALASAAFRPAAQGDRDVLLQANVYYVSTTGRDTNSGSSTAPFKTFAKAVSVLRPGDTLQVMPGTYTESMRLTVSGTANAHITVIGNGAIVNMQGTQTTGIRISGSYVNLSNFEVTGAMDAGIAIPGKYVTVKNNILHNNVTENGVGTCGIAGSYASALKVGVGGEHITIDGNTVYRNCGEGIAITRGVNVLVKNNTVYDNFAPNIYVDNSPYTTVENNLVYCTGAVLRLDGKRPTAIGLGEEFYEGWGAQMHDILVSGNTIRDCGKGIGAFDSEVGGALTNVTITRNYIPSGEGRAISLTNDSSINVVISYNTLFNEPWLDVSAGVTLIGNTINGVQLSDSTFADVRTNHWAWGHIQSIYDAGITGGCSSVLYCPEAAVTRDQMAIFLEKGMKGSSFTPAPASGSTFSDVARTYWAAAWIEQLASDGITGGCGGKLYCPENAVTRAQMAIFLLKAKYGAGYGPPPVGSGTGFNDVPANHWAAAWIKQLTAEGITGGCGNVIFCPDQPVTRAQMAVFLQRTFNLPMP
jgi:parallel beta-helix repeat protein